MSALCFFASALALRFSAASAGGSFLGKASEPVPDPFDQVALLDRFEEALGSGHRQATEARLSDITKALTHTFAALPKNERGAIGTAGARYAIHRLFVQRHGWHVEGVAPEGDQWSSSSPTTALGSSIPGHVHDLLDERFGSHGLDLHELAVLAATLENVIHSEAVQRLEGLYQVYGESTEGTLNEREAEHLMESYMQVYVLGYNVSEITKTMLLHLHSRIEDVLPLWQNTREFLQVVRQELAPGVSEFSFADVSKIVEAVSERYGSHQDAAECEDIQQKLLQLEDIDGKGRVKLHTFYASVSKRDFWQFREHPEFLKQAGVLDDSDPSTPRIMIPNYFNMRSNCFNPSSAFYSICCIDKCEALMDHVEMVVQAPSATPERIVRVVSALPSTSVPANRTLPTELVQRLDEVARQHGGVVPLHGRLFSQWMHFAYPRECSYPHPAGTSTLMSAEDWSHATGKRADLEKEDLESVIADLEQKQQHQRWQQVQPMHLQQACDEESGTCMAMWHSAEELVDAGHWNMTREAALEKMEASSTSANVLRALALLSFVVSSVMAMGSFVQQAGESVTVAFAQESASWKCKATTHMRCFV